MRKRIVLLNLLFLFFGAHPALASKTVSLATTEWIPYVGEHMRNYGFASEIIAEAFRRVGYQVSYAFMPPKRVMKGVEEGEYDAGYPAYYSDERATKFYYSDPFAQGMTGFYKRKDRKIAFKSLRDLAPFKIGVCLGFAYPREFEMADYLKKEVARNEVLNLRKLIEKRIDLFITDRAAAEAAINIWLPDAKNLLEFMAPPLKVRKLYLIFGKRKENQQKLRDFDRGLKMIVKDGTVEMILERYGIRN